MIRGLSSYPDWVVCQRQPLWWWAQLYNTSHIFLLNIFLHLFLKIFVYFFFLFNYFIIPEFKLPRQGSLSITVHWYMSINISVGREGINETRSSIFTSTGSGSHIPQSANLHSMLNCKTSVSVHPCWFQWIPQEFTLSMLPVTRQSPQLVLMLLMLLLPPFQLSTF